MPNILLGLVFEIPAGSLVFIDANGAFALNLGAGDVLTGEPLTRTSGWGIDAAAGVGFHVLSWLLFKADFVYQRYAWSFTPLAGSGPQATGWLSATCRRQSLRRLRAL